MRRHSQVIAVMQTYSLVSNRRGGGWKKSQKLIAGGVGIIGGVGKNLSDSHFLYIVTVKL